MSWTAPRTWVAGEVVTAALLNAQIRDNELILASVPQANSFTSSGTWTKPADCKWLIVELWGGGASGSSAGGGAGTQAMGAGGGGGGYCQQLYPASGVLSSESITVGAGGAGNAVAGNPGTVTTYKGMSAFGGANGASMAGSGGNALANGGVGGTASGGDRNFTGDDGGHGQTVGGIGLFTNHGGGSPHGGGVTMFGGSSQGIGVAGKFPGGGASGSFATTTGFNGANGAGGLAVVYSYFS